MLGSRARLSEVAAGALALGNGSQAPRGLSGRVLGLCDLLMPHPHWVRWVGAGQASAGAGDPHQAGAGSASVQVALMGCQLIQTAPLSPLCPASHGAAPSVGRQRYRRSGPRGVELGKRGRGSRSLGGQWTEAAVLRCRPPPPLQNWDL